MILAFNYRRNAFVSFLAVILLISALILVDPRPSFADRIVPVRQGTTLAVGCDLSNDDRKFIYPSKGNSLLCSLPWGEPIYYFIYKYTS